MYTAKEVVVRKLDRLIWQLSTKCEVAQCEIEMLDTCSGAP